MKKQNLGGFPILRGYEVKALKGKEIEVISEERTVKTANKEAQTVLDVTMPSIPTKEQYEDLDDNDMKAEELESRLADPRRTWFVNGNSINWLVNEHGDGEELAPDALKGKKIKLGYFKLKGWKGIYPDALKEEK